VFLLNTLFHLLSVVVILRYSMKPLLLAISLLVALTAHAQPEFSLVKGSMIQAVSSIATAPDGDIYLMSGTNLFRSTDDGRSWMFVTKTNYGGKAYPISGSKILIGSQSYPTMIYDEATGLLTELKVSVRITQIMYADADVILAYTDQGNMRSTDQGATWQAVQQFGSSYVIRGSNHYRYYTSWERSTDRGATWKPWTADPGFLVAGEAQRLHLLDTSHVKTSTNDGVTWMSHSLPFKLPHVYLSGYAFADHRGRLFVMNPWAASHLYFTSTGGAEWDSIQILSMTVPTYTLLQDGRLLFFGGDFNVFDDGRMQPWSGSITGPQFFADNGSNEMWIASKWGEYYGGTLAVSKDAGLSWVPSRFTPNGESKAVLSHQGRVIATTSRNYYGGTNTINLSSDGGEMWRVVRTLGKDSCITQLISVGNDILAGTNKAGIMRSTDGGETWHETNAGITNGVVYSLHQDRGGRILAGTANGLFISRDGGGSWSRKDVSQRNPEVLSIAVDRIGAIYAGTRGGLFRSSDENTWERIYIGMLDYPVSALTIDSGGNIYAGSPGHVIANEDQDRFLIHFSSNRGASWIDMITPALRPDTNVITGAWTDRTGFVYIGSNAGLYRSSTAPKGLVGRVQHADRNSGGIAFENNRFVIDLKDAITARVDIYDRAGRLLAKGEGTAPELEQALSAAAREVDWIAYTLSTERTTKRGTLLCIQ
jgi:hypothetical protein